MSPDEQTVDLATGATIGTLEWSKEKILGVLGRFKNKDIAFIEDPQTIEDHQDPTVVVPNGKYYLNTSKIKS